MNLLNVYLSLGWIITIVVIGVLILSILLYVLIRNLIDRKRKRLVLKFSSALRELRELNKKYSFINSREETKYCHHLSSRQRFYNFDYDGYTRQVVREHYDEIRKRLDRFDEEDRLYKEYLKEVSSIKLARNEDMANLKVPTSYFIAIEKMEFHKLTKRLLHNRYSIRVDYDYTSKGGNKYYHNYVSFNEANIRRMMDNEEKLRQARIEKEFRNNVAKKKKESKQETPRKKKANKSSNPSINYNINLDEYELDEEALVEEVK